MEARTGEREKGVKREEVRKTHTELHVLLLSKFILQDFAQVNPKCPEYVRDGFNEIYYWAQFGLKGMVSLRHVMEGMGETGEVGEEGV